MPARKSVFCSGELELVCENTKKARALIHRRIITEFMSSGIRILRREKKGVLKNDRLIARRTNGFSITNSDNRGALKNRTEPSIKPNNYKVPYTRITYTITRARKLRRGGYHTGGAP